MITARTFTDLAGEARRAAFRAISDKGVTRPDLLEPPTHFTAYQRMIFWTEVARVVPGVQL